MGSVIGLLSTASIIQGTLLSRVLTGLTFGFMTFSLPAVLSTGLTSIADSEEKFLTVRRSAFLALSAEGLMGFIYLGSLAFQPVLGINSIALRIYGFLAGSIACLALRFIVLLVMSNFNVLKSLFLSAVQPGFSLLLLFAVNKVERLTVILIPELRAWISFPKMAFVTFIIVTTIWAFLKIMNAPLKARYGVGLIEVLNYALAEAMGYKAKMEGFFERMGEEMNSLVTTLVLKSKGRVKAIVVTPYIHAGPYGEIGGSNLPFHLMERVEKRTGAECSFVFHGTCTPDLNPVTKRETLKVVSATIEAINKSLVKMGSKKVSKLVKVEEEGLKVKCQLFGGYPLIIVTRAPGDTEDIDFGVGWALTNLLKAHGYEYAAIVDAHNSIGEWGKPILTNDPKSFLLEELTVKAVKKAEKRISDGLMIGVAKKEIDGKAKDGVGPGGLRFLLVKAGKDKFGYLLIDGNNMVTGLREKVLERFKLHGLMEGEVLTNDNHIVNGFMTGFNPVGLRTNPREILKWIDELIEEAEGNIEPCEAHYHTEKINKILVFGTGKTREFLSLVNGVITISKVLAPFISLLAATVIILSLFI